MADSEKRKKVLLITVIIAIVLGASVFAYTKYDAYVKAHNKVTDGPAVSVLVIEVPKKDVPLVKEWVGTTQGDVNTDIYAKISGYLLKMNYSEGTVVQQGQVLFEIDARPYQSALDQATGALDQSIAAQKKSQADVRRYSSLVGEGAVSQKEYTDSIRNNEMNKAAIASAKAAVDQAKLNLDWTKVTSPLTGMAGAAIAQVGDLIDPTKKLTTISVMDPIKISFPISENEYLWHIRHDKEVDANNPASANTAPGTLQAHAPDITIVLNDGSVYPEKAEFTFTDRQVDPTTGTIAVNVKVANPKGYLRPGQYAKVRAQVGIFKDAVFIPRRAIIETQGTTQVAVIGSDNKVEMRDVKVGYISGNNRIVTEGLKGGETIVVEGFLKIREGMTVAPEKDTSFNKEVEG